MHRQLAHIPFLALVLLFPLASSLPQQPSSTNDPHTSGSPIDASPSESTTSDPDGSPPLDPNYYYVSVALIICVAAVAGFFFWRRKKQISATIRSGRESALRRDIHSFDPVRSRRRYWNGRYRVDDVGREEGLNEQGEAPPPYIPKTHSEGGYGQETNEPAILLQTLSREHAGLKPPDYSVTETQPVDDRRTSTVSARRNSRLH